MGKSKVFASPPLYYLFRLRVIAFTFTLLWLQLLLHKLTNFCTGSSFSGAAAERAAHSA